MAEIASSILDDSSKKKTERISAEKSRTGSPGGGREGACGQASFRPGWRTATGDARVEWARDIFHTKEHKERRDGMYRGTKAVSHRGRCAGEDAGVMAVGREPGGTAVKHRALPRRGTAITHGHGAMRRE